MKTDSHLICTNAGAIVLILLTLCFSQRAQGQQNEINWQTNYESAARLSESTKKPMFINTTTDNCIYCNQHDKTTFQDIRIIQTINEKYIPIKLHNPTIMNITAYPTLIIGYPSKQPIYRKIGYHNPQELINILRK